MVMEALARYDLDRLRIGVLGSHSALEVGFGGKQEGMEVVVVCQKGREKTYAKYYRNLFDHILVLDSFANITLEENQNALRELNTLFVPNRSFSVYVGYEAIENSFAVPIMGNRFLLRVEERNTPRDQYYLLDKAGIRRPRVFTSPSSIDTLAIVKVPEKGRRTERAFFFCSSPEEFHKKGKERIASGLVDEGDLERAVVEEYVLGAKFNANFFWSPLTDELDLLGFDRRIQTDLDGLLGLPASEQLELRAMAQNIEVGHMAATMRESLLETIFEAGEKFVQACRSEYPPGVIGLFALQGALTRDLDFYVFDVSIRVPGSPCVEPGSPYMKYKYGSPVGPGRRIAMEIKLAKRLNRLEAITT